MAAGNTTRDREDVRDVRDDRNGGRDLADEDRRLLAGWDAAAGWDRRGELEDWFDAALGAHRAWLDLLVKTSRLMIPFRTDRDS